MKTFIPNERAAARWAQLPALVLVATLGVAAHAENFAVFPSDTPASYRNECASCHVAFPPGLLSSHGWRDTMDGLAKHFGGNAALEGPQRKEIEDFLVRNAGSPRRFAVRNDPPRLSATLWFKRTHGEVRAAFGDPRIGSAANCLACHAQAEGGHYEPLTPLARQLAGKDRTLREAVR